jgi:hypothetical protein
MTKSERSDIARQLVSLRKTKSGGHNGGRPQSKAPRCKCGAMTIKRATARRHKCQA